MVTKQEFEALDSAVNKRFEETSGPELKGIIYGYLQSMRSVMNGIYTGPGEWASLPPDTPMADEIDRCYETTKGRLDIL